MEFLNLSFCHDIHSNGSIVVPFSFLITSSDSFSPLLSTLGKLSECRGQHYNCRTKHKSSLVDFFIFLSWNNYRFMEDAASTENFVCSLPTSPNGNYPTISKQGNWHWYNLQSLVRFHQFYNALVCVKVHVILSHVWIRVTTTMTTIWSCFITTKIPRTVLL